MAQRKKIIYLVTKSVWGGAQKYVFDLATHLPQDLFDAVVAAGGDGPFLACLAEAGIRTISIPEMQRDISFLKELKSLWRLYQIFKRERPDIIHLNSSKSGGLGALAAFFYNLPQATSHKPQAKTIFTVHGWGFNEDRPWVIRFIIFLASWATALFCHRVIVINTRDFKTGLRFIPRRKLAFIYNGILPIPFWRRGEAREFLRQKIRCLVNPSIVWVGINAELTKNKGLAYFIQAVRELKRIHPDLLYATILIGEGEDQKKLESAIRRHRLENLIFLPGFVPNAAQYLKAFDIFILPSLKEGLPYVIFEAMRAKLAIIASNVGGLQDQIQHEKSGLLVPPKDAAALAKMIQKLILDKRARSALGQEAQKRAEKTFSFDLMLKKTISLYHV